MAVHIRQISSVEKVAFLSAGKGNWIMRKIKLTRANKSILLKALAPYYYRERALRHSTQEVGKLILKINSLPADKKATFSTEEICLM